jgi:hypothetical protein
MENMAPKQFTPIHAQSVKALDGTRVEFRGRYELLYERHHRVLIVPIEPWIADDLAPDGCVVFLNDSLKWSDGMSLLPSEYNEVVLDLGAAAVPLRTKFRFPMDR